MFVNRKLLHMIKRKRPPPDVPIIVRQALNRLARMVATEEVALRLVLRQVFARFVALKRGIESG